MFTLISVEGAGALSSRAVTVVAGIEVPSTSPVFLTLVGFHVLVGLACVVTGAVAMFSRKSRGRHPGFGTAYYWGLVAVFASASALAVMPGLNSAPT